VRKRKRITFTPTGMAETAMKTRQPYTGIVHLCANETSRLAIPDAQHTYRAIRQTSTTPTDQPIFVTMRYSPRLDGGVYSAAMSKAIAWDPS
jgi:hypothetical protein